MLVVPFECITTITVSVVVPVNVPVSDATRVTVRNVLPSTLRTLVVVLDTRAKVPAEGFGGVADTGAAVKIAARPKTSSTASAVFEQLRPWQDTCALIEA